MREKNLILIMSFLTLCWFPMAWAEEPTDMQPLVQASSDPWSFSAFMTYENGDFDTEKTTQTLYVPFTLTRYFSQGEASVTIPYIYQKGPGGVTSIKGKPFQTSRTTSSTREEEGLGDMILGGKYYLLNENSREINLNAAASLKLPTADDDQGLGTGEFDETFGLEASKSLNAEWAIYLDLYYTFIGDPDDLNLNNQFTYDIGAGYQLDEKTQISAYYSESTALVDDLDNARALSSFVNYTLDQQINLLGGLSIGLSEGSPAFGLTGGINIRF